MVNACLLSSVIRNKVYKLSVECSRVLFVLNRYLWSNNDSQISNTNETNNYSRILLHLFWQGRAFPIGIWFHSILPRSPPNLIDANFFLAGILSFFCVIDEKKGKLDLLPIGNPGRTNLHVSLYYPCYLFFPAEI